MVKKTCQMKNPILEHVNLLLGKIHKQNIRTEDELKKKVASIKKAVIK